MRGEHGVHHKTGNQLVEVRAPLFRGDPLGRVGEGLPRRAVTGIAAPERADALLFFRHVDQVKVDGEGACHLFGPVP